MTHTQPSSSRLSERARPLIIAHRGASGEAPENTAPAFALALEARSDLIELDYHHTAEGQPVVIHDETLARTTDAEEHWGAGLHPVETRLWAELSTLEAGLWFDPPQRGVRLPSLEAALQQIQAGSTTLIERKAGDAATLVALLGRLDMVEDVIVQAFDWDFLEAVRALAPEIRLAALGKGEISSAAWERLSKLDVDAVGWRHRDVTRPLVAEAHARGLQVWAYTIDDPGRAAKLVNLGVDGIITNRPASMRAALRGDG